jgi:hypothetical protein
MNPGDITPITPSNFESYETSEDGLTIYAQPKKGAPWQVYKLNHPGAVETARYSGEREAEFNPRAS